MPTLQVSRKDSGPTLQPAALEIYPPCYLCFYFRPLAHSTRVCVAFSMSGHQLIFRFSITGFINVIYSVMWGSMRRRYAQNDSAAPSQSRRPGQYIYLSDWAPGGTAAPWASHCQSSAPTVAAIAHPCRRTPFLHAKITTKTTAIVSVRQPGAETHRLQRCSSSSVRGQGQIRKWGGARMQPHSGINTPFFLCRPLQMMVF